MQLEERIVVNPQVLVGKPVVRGTRLSVDFLLGLMAQGWSEAEILRNYPGLEREDLLACLGAAGVDVHVGHAAEWIPGDLDAVSDAVVARAKDAFYPEE